jgi:hypothetical protein
VQLSSGANSPSEGTSEDCLYDPVLRIIWFMLCRA